MKTTMTNGKNGHQNQGGGRIGRLLESYIQAGVVDAEAPVAVRSPEGPYPVVCKEIPDQKAEEKKLGAFLGQVGIKRISPASPTLLSDGTVEWKFTGLITPAVADKIIKHHNDHNRIVGPQRGSEYASYMKSGLWGYTAEPLIFSNKGSLLDGQNRMLGLSALDEGVSIPFAVTFGVPSTAITYMGRGLVRTNAHQGQAEGRSYTAVRTPTLVIINRFEQSRPGGQDWLDADPRTAPKLSGPQNGKLNESHKVSLDPALEFVHGLRWAIGRKALPRHIGTFMFMHCSRIHAQAARYFLAALADGTHALPGSPIYTLRTNLLQYSAQNSLNLGHSRRKVPSDDGSKVVIHRSREAVLIRTIASAWNSFCAGKTKSSSKIKVRSDKSTVELIRDLAAPGPRAVEEASVFTEEFYQAYIKKAADCAANEARKTRERLSDKGDVKKKKIRKKLATA